MAAGTLMRTRGLSLKRSPASVMEAGLWRARSGCESYEVRADARSKAELRRALGRRSEVPDAAR